MPHRRANLHLGVARRALLDRHGSLSVLAGQHGVEGCSLGCGTETLFRAPHGIALSPNEDSLLVCDCENHRVVRIHLASGFAVVVAGTGEKGGRDGHKDVATLQSPISAVEDGDGVVYISTDGGCTVRRVDPTDGMVTTIAGCHATPGTQDGDVAESRLAGPKQMALCSMTKRLFVRCGQRICAVSTKAPEHTVTSLRLNIEKAGGTGLALGSSGALFLNTLGGLFQALPPGDGLEGSGTWTMRNIATAEAMQVPGTGFHLCLSVNGQLLLNSYLGFHVVRGATHFLQDPPARAPVPKDSNLYRIVQHGFGKEAILAQVANTRFLVKSAHLAYQESNLRNLLHIAAGGGAHEANVGVLQSLLDLGLQELVGHADCDGLTPIHYACGARSPPSLNAVRLLISFSEVNCVAEDNQGNDPLYYAAGAIHTAIPEIVELLLMQKANPDRKDREGYHRIHLAAGAKCSPSPQTMYLLYSAGVDPEVKDGRGRSVLQYGSELGLRGAEPGKENCDSGTPKGQLQGSPDVDIMSYTPPHEKAIAQMLTQALGVLEAKLFETGDLDVSEQKRLEDLHRLCVMSLDLEIEGARLEQPMLRELVQVYDMKYKDPYKLIHTTLAADPKYDELMAVLEKRQKLCTENNGDFFLGDGSCHQISSYIEGFHTENPNFSGNGRYMRTDRTKNGKPVFTHQKQPFSVYWEDGSWIVGGLDGGATGQGFWDTLVVKSDAEEPQFVSSQWLLRHADKKPVPVPFSFRPFSLLDLFRCATICKRKYDKLFRQLAMLTGEQDSYLRCRPKGFYRTWEKAATFMGERKFVGETVCDIVRGALQYDRMSNMLLAIQLLCALDPYLLQKDPSLNGFSPCVPKCEDQADDFAIHILDIKNRYAKPTRAGWCDIAVRAYFRSDPTKHVFEVQFVHLDMFRCRARLGAHHGYSYARAAFELLEIINNGGPNHEASPDSPRVRKRMEVVENVSDTTEPAAEPAVQSSHSRLLAEESRWLSMAEQSRLQAESQAELFDQIATQTAVGPSTFVPRPPPGRPHGVSSASLELMRAEMRAEMMEQLRVKDQQMQAQLQSMQSQFLAREQQMKNLHIHQMTELRNETQVQVDMLRAQLHAVGVVSEEIASAADPSQATKCGALPPLDPNARKHSK